MKLLPKFLWTAAFLSLIMNGVGAPYALLKGEWMHGGTHVALFALTVLLIAIFRPRARRTSDDSSWADAESLQSASQSDVRMEQLQQSVDAIAIEVERIGQQQRFHAKLAAKQTEGAGRAH